ncbi:RAMP superfamily CRISPR-associated protein [Kineosporia babensis]|uniref:RAMP superfamily CRISPR-associated protein n=1 Tax=Kineosporia babensis TaxID=499548 RepID=A0A9X1NMP1_9ACTN|nr:RAMP superfamily CRISPR-associated protein [Kineosporia babensis]
MNIRFVSDWHVGTGDGRAGVVDAAVHRDPAGLPYVPGKSLTGHWRDACATVADALDTTSATTTNTRSWAQWAEWLFGTDNQGGPEGTGSRLPGETPDASTALDSWVPLPASVGIGPGVLPDRWRETLSGKPALIEGLFCLRPGVALDPVSGTAREEHLRLEERVMAGLPLSAEVRATVSGGETQLPEPAELLLRAGARLVDGLGGKRNRGAGRVHLILPGVEMADDLAATLTEATADGSITGWDPAEPQDLRLQELLADTDLLDAPGPTPPPPQRPPALPLGSGSAASPVPGNVQDAWTYRVVFRVQTPVLAAVRRQGNVQESSTEIPGTTLFPAVLERLTSNDQVGLSEISVGNAVPAVQVPDGTVAAAHLAPLTWFNPDKGRSPLIINRSCTGEDRSRRAKPARGRYARSQDVSWQAVAVEFTDSTHPVIDDRLRRPVESAGGGLFTYLGIAAGTLLVSEIRLPQRAGLRLKSGDVLRIGRSRKDDFGQLRVESVTGSPDSVHPSSQALDRSRLQVWCISDVLLRGERLQPDPTPRGLAREVGRRLNKNLQVLMDETFSDGSGSRLLTATAVRRTEGFRPRWHRPRPAYTALSAGSVVTLATIDGSMIDGDLIAELERTGVGERVAEGYGQVRIDPLELTTESPAIVEPISSAPGPSLHTPLDDLPISRPTPVEQACWLEIVRRRTAQLVLSPPSSLLPLEFSPGRSQLGALRTQLSRLPLDATMPQTEVHEWFRGLQASLARLSWSPQTYEAARALLLGVSPHHGRLGGDEPLHDRWERHPVWDYLGLSGAQPDLVLAAGREPLLRRALLRDAQSTVLLGLLRHHQAQTSAAGEAPS